MKKIILLFVLFTFSATARAAITITDRGSGGTETDVTTLVITPASNFTAGSFGVLAIAYDNDGGGGADSFTSIVDSVGNTWTSRQNLLYDPGAANAGVVVRIFTAQITTLTTSNTITLTWSAALPAKAYTLMQVSGAAGTVIQYVTGGTDAGESATAPTFTTGSITNTNVVFAAFAAEWTNTFTADSDTSNGTWSSGVQAQSSGTAADTSMAIDCQRKIVTATATQTFNPTLPVARDVVGAWIELREIKAATSGFFF
jgi:hypothetical protein